MTITELVNDPAAHHYAVTGWRCDVCDAKAGKQCTNPINPDKPLPGRQIHFARLIDRRRQPKGSDDA